MFGAPDFSDGLKPDIAPSRREKPEVAVRWLVDADGVLLVKWIALPPDGRDRADGPAVTQSFAHEARDAAWWCAPYA
jgi:hypothetical protein